jgi:hypothetical protein
MPQFMILLHQFFISSYLKITFDGQAVCPVVNFAPTKNVKGTFLLGSEMSKNRLRHLFKIPPPAIGGLFYGVSSGSGLGRASNTRSENKNLYLETNEYSSTPPFSKKAFGGSYLRVKSAREIIWRELFKKTFGGKKNKKPLRGNNFKNYLAGTISKTHLAGTLAGTFWRDLFFLQFENSMYEMLLF